MSDTVSSSNVVKILMEYVYNRDMCSICKKGGVYQSLGIYCFTSDGSVAHNNCFELIKEPIMKIDQYLRERYPKYKDIDCMNILLMKSFGKFKKQENIKNIKSFFKNNGTDDFMVRFCNVIFMEIAVEQTTPNIT
jgi:hypothetical protein